MASAGLTNGWISLFPTTACCHANASFLQRVSLLCSPDDDVGLDQANRAHFGIAKLLKSMDCGTDLSSKRRRRHSHTGCRNKNRDGWSQLNTLPWRITWRKYLPVLAVIVGSLLALDSHLQSASAPANWKQDWDATQRAAEKEGRLIIYGPRGADQEQLYSERFQQAFPGIKVNYSAGRMSEVISRIMAEQRAGLRQADLVLGGTDILLGTLKDKGLLQ